jgi:hypothetical protein
MISFLRYYRVSDGFHVGDQPVSSLPVPILSKGLESLRIVLEKIVIHSSHRCNVLISTLQWCALDKHGKNVASVDIGVESHRNGKLEWLQLILIGIG